MVQNFTFYLLQDVKEKCTKNHCKSVSRYTTYQDIIYDMDDIEGRTGLYSNRFFFFLSDEVKLVPIQNTLL